MSRWVKWVQCELRIHLTRFLRTWVKLTLFLTFRVSRHRCYDSENFRGTTSKLKKVESSKGRVPYWYIGVPISLLTCLYSCKRSIKIQSNFSLMFLKNSSLVFLIVPPDTGSTPTFLFTWILVKTSLAKQPISRYDLYFFLNIISWISWNLFGLS